jgi:hypothetical protein
MNSFFPRGKSNKLFHLIILHATFVPRHPDIQLKIFNSRWECTDVPRIPWTVEKMEKSSTVHCHMDLVYRNCGKHIGGSAYCSSPQTREALHPLKGLFMNRPHMEPGVIQKFSESAEILKKRTQTSGSATPLIRRQQSQIEHQSCQREHRIVFWDAVTKISIYSWCCISAVSSTDDSCSF